MLYNIIHNPGAKHIQMFLSVHHRDSLKKFVLSRRKCRQKIFIHDSRVHISTTQAQIRD